MMPRHVKIIATLGPSSADFATMLAMVEAGVDVFRINLSHADQKTTLDYIQKIQSIREQTGKRLAVLIDLQGPKIRVGDLSEPLPLEEDELVLLTDTERYASLRTAKLPTSLPSKVIPIGYHRLLEDIQVGHRILFDDGRLAVRVQEKKQEGWIARVEIGGVLHRRKGVNFPDSTLAIPALTEKDMHDLRWLIQTCPDQIHWIALSFVRSAQDIRRLKEVLAHLMEGQPVYLWPRVIAKIEKPQAIENFSEILQEADAIMIARGDLGVELPYERLPILQKQLIAECIRHAKPSIVATQIFEHMIQHPYPTRAEVNDVANIVYDGADAVMLSNETSVGKYPVRVIQIMDRILRWIEDHIDEIYLPKVGTGKWGAFPREDSPTFRSDVVCFQACKMAVEVNARAILSMTSTGYTAFQISSYRPRSPIFIFTHNRYLLDLLNLVWGVYAFYYDRFESTDRTIEDVIAIVRERGYVQPGDIVINTASMPIHARGRTNMIKISVVE